MLFFNLLLSSFASVFIFCSSLSKGDDDDDDSVRVHNGITHSDVMVIITERHENCADYDSCPEDVEEAQMSISSSIASSSTPAYSCSSSSCTSASLYPCSKIDMYSHVSLSELGGASFGNDIWGWTDSSTGKEYALAGVSDGTSVVDISNPNSPNVIAFIKSQTTTSTYWRDMKVYEDYVYIVQDGTTGHGLQYVNLKTLISRASSTSGIYYLESSDSLNQKESSISKCHNVFVNEDTGYLYAVGTDQASGGLYIYDVSNPGNPTYAGQYASDGYTHDVQCVVYAGPDSRYTGNEICFAYNEDSVTIVDVTDKNNPKQLSRTTYTNSKYCHQGWIDESHTYVYMDDELDEMYLSLSATTTFVFDCSNLENPSLVSNSNPFESSTHGSIDHNHYVMGNYLYQGHYRAGVRILDISNPSSLNEVAYFDTYVNDNAAEFDGIWSVYPYFSSGILIGQDTAKGLFVLKFNANNNGCGEDSDDDSSDDDDSSGGNCDSSEFECNDGCCIPSGYQSDNYCDCSDCEDENSWTCNTCGNNNGATCDSTFTSGQCGGYFKCNFVKDVSNCGDNEFECNNGCCIPSNYQDDNYCDCEECEDEPDWTCNECSCDNIDSCMGGYQYCGSSGKSSAKTDGNGGSDTRGRNSDSNSNSDNNVLESAGFIVGMCILAVAIVFIIGGCMFYRKRKMTMANQVSYSNQPDKGYVPPTNENGDAVAVGQGNTQDGKVY